MKNVANSYIYSFAFLVVFFLLSFNQAIAHSVTVSESSSVLTVGVYNVSYSSGDYVRILGTSYRANCNSSNRTRIYFQYKIGGTATTSNVEYGDGPHPVTTSVPCTAHAEYSFVATSSGSASVRVEEINGGESRKAEITVISAPDGGGGLTEIATSTVRGMFSASSASNLLTYNSSTGVFTTDNTTFWNGSIASTSVWSKLSGVSPISFNSTNGQISIDTSGDWEGTLDGLEGIDYLDLSIHDGTILSANVSDLSTVVRGLFSASSPLVYDSGSGSFTCPSGCSGAGGEGGFVEQSDDIHYETFQAILFVLALALALYLFVWLVRGLRLK